MKKAIKIAIVLVIIGLAIYFIHNWKANALYRNPAFASGNGRIEATEINIAAKLAGKVEKVLVQEGESVDKDKILVVMQTNVLEANLAQAQAKLAQTITAEVSARADIEVKEANLVSAQAEVERVAAEAKFAKEDYDRYSKLVQQDAATKQMAESAESKWFAKKAELSAKQADMQEAKANLNMAKANAAGAKANILAAKAEIESIKADIDDSILKAPLQGRIQYRIAEPGEVLSAGGRALNMVDLTDVYMTFFLPEAQAGLVKIGAEARIILDVMPDVPVAAKITYVASVAQFTPKTVETKIERQKLMFRVKAQVSKELLIEHIDLVKTGLPGIAWVRLDPSVPWPVELQTLQERGLVK